MSVSDSSLQTIHKLNYLQGGMELLTPISENYNENSSGLNSRRNRPLNAASDNKISEEDIEIQSVASSEHNRNFQKATVNEGGATSPSRS